MDDAALLEALPGFAFAFVLVLARTSMTVMLMPGLGEADPPPTIRAGIALAITVLLLPIIAPLVPAVPDSGMASAGMVTAELCVGALLGWLARLPVLALTMAGSVVSYMVGLSNVVQTDPALGGQSAAMARLFGLVAPVLVLSTGLYALPLSALAGSYDLVAPGTLLPAGPLADTIATGVSFSVGLAIRLSAPFLLIGTVFQVGLGLLARLVPQLQPYGAAVPGQILGGLALLAILALPMLTYWTDAVRSAWSVLPGL